MPTPIQRRAIHDDLHPAWDAAEHPLRCAMEVIDWCASEGIHLAGLEARDLDIAMAEMPVEHQGPADFLDVACALAAVRRAAPKDVNAELLEALQWTLDLALAQFPKDVSDRMEVVKMARAAIAKAKQVPA